MGNRKHLMAEKLKEAKKATAVAKLNDVPTSPRKMRLVADHLLSNVNRNKLVSIMNGDCVADEVRGDHAGAGPGLDHLFLFAAIIHGKYPLFEGFLNVWTFS